MALYHYEALDSAGKTTKGTIGADTEKGARSKLRTQALIPLVVEPITEGKSKTKTKTKKIDSRIKTTDLYLFTSELASLISAGLEVEESLFSVAHAAENKKLKKIILSIHEKILEGYSFSHAISEYPKAFPDLYRATIYSGEEAGHLGYVLEHLAMHLEAQQKINQKIVQALLYPSILTIVSLSIVVFLLTYVTPKIIAIFQDSDHVLPLATRCLIFISDGIRHQGWLILFIIIIAIFLFKSGLKNQKFKYYVDTALLKIPFIGKTLIMIQTSRFLRALSILVKSKVPILDALRVSNDLIYNVCIHAKIQISAQQIKEGQTIYAAFKRTGYFSSVCLQFIASGERSGEIESMLSNAAKQQEKQVQYSLDTLLTIFEPLMILMMGGIVLFIVLAVLLPMFQISSLI